MGRRVELAFIANDSSRKARFNKRKKGLLKKTYELSTLCGIPACAIIYGEKDQNPSVWPPSSEAVHKIISKFQEMSVTEQSKNMLSQETFLAQRIEKVKEELKKIRKENLEHEMETLMYRGLSQPQSSEWLQGLSLGDLKNLGFTINQTLDKVVEQLDEKKGKEFEGSEKAADSVGPSKEGSPK